MPRHSSRHESSYNDDAARRANLAIFISLGSVFLAGIWMLVHGLM